MFLNNRVPTPDGNLICFSLLGRQLILAAIMQTKKHKVVRFKWLDPEFAEHCKARYQMLLDLNLAVLEQIAQESTENYTGEDDTVDSYVNAGMSFKKFCRKEKQFLKKKKKQQENTK